MLSSSLRSYTYLHSLWVISVCGWIMKRKRIRQWFMLIKIKHNICRKYANEKLQIKYKCLSRNIPWEEHILPQKFRDLKIHWTSQSTTADPCIQNQPRGLRTRHPTGCWKRSNRNRKTLKSRLEAAPHCGSGQNTSKPKEDWLQEHDFTCSSQPRRRHKLTGGESRPKRGGSFRSQPI